MDCKEQICDSILRTKFGMEVELQKGWKKVKQVLVMKSRGIKVGKSTENYVPVIKI